MLTPEQVETIRGLLNSPYDFSTPFPMAVFGTLRVREGNNYLMSSNGKPTSVSRAFLPNFSAVGITLQGEKGSTAPFEIFHYEPEEWKKMIPRVDRLEGFSFNGGQVVESWYLRTLAMLRIVSDEDPIEFPTLRKSYRNLQLPQESWSTYEEIPCWIYSNPLANEKSGGDSIIWTGNNRTRLGRILEKVG